jgi:DNA-binding response OmpR family regulator
MADEHNAQRRLLIVDARPEALDQLVVDISARLAEAGWPVRRVVSHSPERSSSAPAPAAVVGAGDLVVIPESRVARRAGVDLGLTRIEFDLLFELLRQANRVLTKEALLRSVWHHESVTANAIEARVSRLRAKLERVGPRVIHTVRGVGYVLHAVPDRALGAGVVIELVSDDAGDLAPPSLGGQLSAQASPA